MDVSTLTDAEIIRRIDVLDAMLNHVRTVHIARKPKKAKLVPPLYLTEMDVTRAIANGTLIGNAQEAYRLAREWKKAQAHGFRRPEQGQLKRDLGLSYRYWFPSL